MKLRAFICALVGSVSSHALAGCADTCQQGDQARCDKSVVEECRITSGRTATWHEAFDCASVGKVCAIGDETHERAMDYCVTPAADASVEQPDAGAGDSGAR